LDRKTNGKRLQGKIPIKSLKGKLAILCDFDGTVTIEEVSVSLLKKYTGEHWLKADRDLYSGKITIRETMRREFALLKAPRAEMEEFVRSINLRQGFREFAKAAKKGGSPLVIASEGLDFYIDAFLKHYGLDVEFRTNRAIFTDAGIKVEYPYSWEECDKCGNCKYAHLMNFKRQGYTVVYIGDGISDRCPARKADILFARNGLFEYCRREGIECIPYENFDDVMNYLWPKPDGVKRKEPTPPRGRKRIRAGAAGGTSRGKRRAPGPRRKR